MNILVRELVKQLAIGLAVSIPLSAFETWLSAKLKKPDNVIYVKAEFLD